MSVTKAANPATVVPGQTVTFPIVVTNAGPSDATNVTVSDVFDTTALSFVGVDRPECTPLGGGFTCSLPTLAAGASFPVNLTAAVPPDFTGTSVSNSASTLSAVPDPTPGNDTATATATVGPPEADLAMTKAVEPASVVAGGQVTYTMTVLNDAGPSGAQGVVLTDALPAGLTAVSASTDRGTCVVGPPVSCTIGTLFINATATVTIVVDVASSVPPGPVTNTASAAGTTIDPNPGKATGSATTTVTGQADLSVTKTAPQAVAGAPLTYTITASNDGPSDAAAAVISDVLPPDFTFVSSTASQGSCAAAGGTVTCSLGTVPDGGSATVTITAVVPPTFTGTADNVATIASATPDPDPNDDTATFTTSAGTQADVSITKTPDSTVTAGDQVTYTVVVSNAGPSAAAGVVMTDPLPAGLTPVSATSAPQGSCTVAATITCNLGTVNPAVAVTITITAAIDPATPSGSRLVNDASVTDTTFDPTDSNNTATATTTTDAAVDLTVTKTVLPPLQPPPLAAGQFMQFEIDTTNSGPSVASAVSVRDSITAGAFPSGVNINGTDLPDPGSVCSFTSGDIICPIGDIAPGATTTMIFTIVLDPGDTIGSYANTATVSTTTPEANLANNASTAPFDIVRTEADLALSKIGPASVAAGDTFSYNLELNHLGPSDAQDVVVTDTLPAGFTPTAAESAQGACTIAGQVVTCSLSTVRFFDFLVDPAHRIVLNISGTVDPATPNGPVTNTATVTTTTPDPVAADNTASARSTVMQLADLHVEKLADNDPIVAGASAGFTLTVTNAGPSTATGVVLTDALPAAIVFDAGSSDPACTPGPPVTCTLGAVAPGATRIVRVVGQVDAATTTAGVTNTASVTATTADPNAADNQASVTLNLTPEADLSVTKVPDSSTPAAGSPLTYQITVVNNGPSDASAVAITDEIPSAGTLVSVTPTGTATCTPGPPVTCSIASLPAGASESVAVVVQLDPLLNAGSLTNTATVASNTPDPDPSNNSATAVVDSTVTSDLGVTKTLVTNPVVAGAPVSYRLDVVNHGPSIAPNVVISDTLPPGTSFTSASAGCTPQTLEGLTIVGCAEGVLAVGASTSATLTITPDAAFTGSLANTAIVGAAAFDPKDADNTSLAAAEVVQPADVAVTVLAEHPVVSPGGTAAFIVTVGNNGPAPGTNVVLTDTFPPGFSGAVTVSNAAGFHAAAVSCTVAGDVATCPIGNLAVGETGTVRFSGPVPAGTPDGTVLTDAAHVVGAEVDVVPANNDASATVVVQAGPAPGPGPTPSPPAPAPAPPTRRAPAHPAAYRHRHGRHRAARAAVPVRRRRPHRLRRPQAPDSIGIGRRRLGSYGRPSSHSLARCGDWSDGTHEQRGHRQWARGDLNPHVLSDTGT